MVAQVGDKVYQFSEYAAYSATADSIAGGATSVDQVDILADSDFMIQKITYAVYDAADGALVADPNLTVYLTDTGSGRNIFDNPLPISAIAGTGELPFIPPTAKLLKAKSSLTVTFVNRGNTSVYNVALVLHGTKYYA